MAVAAEQAGANEAASERPGSGSESELDQDPTPGGTAGGTGEEASMGVSGYSGAEWSGVGRSIEITGGNFSKTT